MRFSQHHSCRQYMTLKIFLFWIHKANFVRLRHVSSLAVSSSYRRNSLSLFSFQFIPEDKHLLLTLEHVKNVWLIFLLTIKYIRVFKNTYPDNSCAALESCLRRRGKKNQSQQTPENKVGINFLPFFFKKWKMKALISLEPAEFSFRVAKQ